MEVNSPMISATTFRRAIRSQVEMDGGKEGRVRFGKGALRRVTGGAGRHGGWLEAVMHWLVSEGLAVKCQCPEESDGRPLTLTRTGRHVVDSIYDGDVPMVEPSEVKTMELALRHAADEAMNWPSVIRVFGSGPWMRGAWFGPVVVGMETSGWELLAVSERSRVMSSVMSNLFVPESKAAGHLMVFNGSDGVPERLRLGVILAARQAGVLGQIGRVQGSLVKVDEGEKAYRARLMRELEEFGIPMDEAALHAGFNWVQKLGRGRSLDKSIHFEVKRMLGQEAWTTSVDAV